eukprot:4539085-Pyramimonas_sp.AAC.1
MVHPSFAASVARAAPSPFSDTSSATPAVSRLTSPASALNSNLLGRMRNGWPMPPGSLRAMATLAADKTNHPLYNPCRWPAGLVARSRQRKGRFAVDVLAYTGACTVAVAPTT